jgi:dienelactone hydrolase
MADVKAPRSSKSSDVREQSVRILAGEVRLDGDLAIPDGAEGIVLFAHGSGSSRHSPRNRFVARTLQEAGLATLLMDLLTSDEEEEDRYTAQIRFDIGLLADRLTLATDWVRSEPGLRGLRIGYFGASTGAAAALVAAAYRHEIIEAVVSRGGRPDLAEPALSVVDAATLLIVGGDDIPVIPLNRKAYDQLTGEKRLEIIPGATHLFEEPGALEQVAALAADWFTHHLTTAGGGLPAP